MHHAKRDVRLFATKHDVMPKKESSDDMKPFTIIVQLDINPNMINQFIQVNKIDVDESRKEAGCLRFDTVKNIRSKT